MFPNATPLVSYRSHVKAPIRGSEAMDKKSRRKAQRGYMFLTAFIEIDDRLPVAMARAFLMVALNEGKSLGEYAKMADVTTSTMSRHLQDLGPKNRKNEPGFGLLDIQTDPLERRKNTYTLTHKGRVFLDKLVSIMTPLVPGAPSVVSDVDEG